MATTQSTVDYLLDQISSLRDTRARKMFGEYALYYHEKLVALICDDQLFMKPTTETTAFAQECTEAPAYPGSKNYLLVPEEKWEDREWLTTFIQETAAALPLPKPKKQKVT